MCVCHRSNVVEFDVGSKSLRASLYFSLSKMCVCVLGGGGGGGGGGRRVGAGRGGAGPGVPPPPRVEGSQQYFSF